MDGVEKIKKEIMAEAEAESAKLLEDAKKRAAEMKQEARKKAGTGAKSIEERSKKDAELEQHRILSLARLEAHNSKLETRDELIKSVLDDTSKNLTGLRKSGKARYEKALKALIGEATEELGKSNLTLILSKDDSELGKKLAKEYSATIGAPAEISGGVIVETKDGSLRVDNSFEQRFERGMDALRNEIASILFTSPKGRDEG